MAVCCCFKCAKRRVGCHSTCPEYIAYMKKNAAKHESDADKDIRYFYVDRNRKARDRNKDNLY